MLARFLRPGNISAPALLVSNLEEKLICYSCLMGFTFKFFIQKVFKISSPEIKGFLRQMTEKKAEEIKNKKKKFKR